jgi:mRNA interferase YafQ
LNPVRTAQFRRDVKVQVKRGKDMARLRAVVQALCSRETLAAYHADHQLGGGLKGWRDCHVEPDWVLIYRVDGAELILGRTGTHSDLLE